MRQEIMIGNEKKWQKKTENKLTFASRWRKLLAGKGKDFDSLAVSKQLLTNQSSSLMFA